MSELRNRLDQLHTTELGVLRIKRNLGLGENCDVVAYCRAKINDPTTKIEKIGKNFYATTAKEVITVNASKCSVITAHAVKFNSQRGV